MKRIGVSFSCFIRKLAVNRSLLEKLTSFLHAYVSIHHFFKFLNLGTLFPILFIFFKIMFPIRFPAIQI
jgi:hypothetical protein